MTRSPSVSFRASLFALVLSACGACPDASAETAVIVEARFSGDGMAVDDATLECLVDGVATGADSSGAASGRYVCRGPAGSYNVRLMRSGVVTGRMVEVGARDGCGLPAVQTVELTVFGP